MGVTSDWLQARDSEYLAFLRSVSIFVIVFGHVGGFWFYPPWTEFLHVFVPIFFSISGAVSYNVFLRKRSVPQYLSKRIIGLLAPYYCICIIALLVFVIQNSKLPEFNLPNLIKWVTITPTNSIMPFPLGQVWFLHTLLILNLVSPLIFWLYRRHPSFLIIFLSCSILASAAQIHFNIAPFLAIAGHNLFKPLVHILFFCFGFMVIDQPKLRSPYISFVIVTLCLFVSILLVALFNLNPNYAFHTYSPDLYYVTGSLGAVWLFLLLQPYILKIYELLPLMIHGVSDFIFRNTFAIYLLHSFSIYFVEKVFGLVNPPQKTISYGIIKLMLVLLITLILSPMFTKVSSLMGKRMLMLALTGSRTKCTSAYDVGRAA